MSRPRPRRSSRGGLPARPASTRANARPIRSATSPSICVAVEAADVVGLEDLGRCAHAPWQRRGRDARAGKVRTRAGPAAAASRRARGGRSPWCRARARDAADARRARRRSRRAWREPALDASRSVNQRRCVASKMPSAAARPSVAARRSAADVVQWPHVRQRDDRACSRGSSERRVGAQRAPRVDEVLEHVGGDEARRSGRARASRSSACERRRLDDARRGSAPRGRRGVARAARSIADAPRPRRAPSAPPRAQPVAQPRSSTRRALARARASTISRRALS